MEDNANFPNPGRGFYHANDNFEQATLDSYPLEGITLVLREYHIDEFNNTKLPVWYLWNIRRDLSMIRKAGLKVILRFRYTARTTKPYGDAPLNIVLMHIKQLEPVLRENSDVIFTFQAGFIGAWGEWYYTDYFSQSPGVITEQNWIDRRALVDALLDMLPPEIMVNVRTPNYKKHLLNQESYNPVTADEAYKNLPVARISHHNDCFLASLSDVGTYTDTAVQKPYLAEDTKYTVIGGETCGQSGYSHCENALKELKRFHWSYLNRDYHQGVIGDWIDEGCYPSIQKKLGYRFRLIDGDFTTESNPEGTVNIKLNLLNDGFSNPSNPMDVEFILRNISDGKEYISKLNGDMRFWPIDDTIQLDLSYGLPHTIETGDYALFLRISDAHISIKDNPSYCVRLANDSLWEDTTGYNRLNHTLSVNNNSTGKYSGGNFFSVKNSIVPDDLSIIVDGFDDDWTKVPEVYHLENQNTKTLKAWNINDSLYFMLSGDNMEPETVFYIDADNSDTTGSTSFDYKLTCCALYFYNDSNQWEQLTDATVNFAATSQVKEISLPISDLSHIPLGTKYRVQAISGTENIPDMLETIPVIELNTLSDRPLLKVINSGNINTLYWNRNVRNSDGYTEIVRSYTDQNQTYSSVIATVSNNIISLQDKSIEPNMEYSYSVKHRVGNNFSASSGNSPVQTGSDQQSYISIKLDGSSGDWNLCKPAATGVIDDSLVAIRLFNAGDSLFFSFDNNFDTITSYQLYFNIDGESGFEYQISNDSLFANENQSWVLLSVIQSYRSLGFIEAGIKFSGISIDTIDYFTASARINGVDVWGNDEEFGYLKYETLPPPDHFALKPSSEVPYHRIKIKWLFDSNPDAYVIERSVDDSLHFTTLTEVDNSTSYYLDNDVDSSHVYYYKMFSYKDILRSPNTKIESMRPGFAGFNSLYRISGSVDVFPVPVENRATINIGLNSPGNISVELLELSGKSVKKLFQGYCYDEKVIEFKTNDVVSGVYMIEVKGGNTYMVKKIVVH